MANNQFYDVIIVGGGSSGMMAAISVKIHHPDYSVLIVDHAHELGRKLSISGAGRGNLTNVNLVSNPADFYYGDKDLIKSVFTEFDYKQIEKFFQELGIPLYVEQSSGRGKVFPAIDHARTVKNIIINKLNEHNIDIITDLDVIKVDARDKNFLIHAKEKDFESKYCILATGGKSYPALGSDGSGYSLASNLGHNIIEPVPSAVPLVSKNLLSHLLQGEKITMKVSLLISGQISNVVCGEVMFTQYGFSGPAILDVSRNVSVAINRNQINDVSLILNMIPARTDNDLLLELNTRWSGYPKRTVSESLWGLFTQKTSGAICAYLKFDKNKTSGTLTDSEKIQIVKTITAYEVNITATRGWNEAEFTAGGIDTSEINHQTLQSKIVKNLYFAGEILDIDGFVGGFNLSWAWASGWVSGRFSG